ncbi:hypothetical protein CWC16_14100 [Pseudoalteromonas sp. S3776]|uniref:hypothetical protein n=1 Tax=Pseudoalteromonas sp. S3776 TaxID=579544 RepID=UPI001109B55C|nr:hypothetical protein [Pseudoalteromonas sp. S3776]TMO79027.1 hypothetical protein CWC16_14100 [Pseudoalteromonas sp. S3776]
MNMMNIKSLLTLLLILSFNVKTVLADTAIRFNGVDSYASFDVWQPTGPFKIVVWLGEVPSDPSKKTYLLSNSNTKEFVLFNQSSVQMKFGDKYPGIWNKLNFYQTRFLEITVKDGELIASDGVKSVSVKKDYIDPIDISFDWLFRRSNKFSEGALQGLGLIDLNNFENSRNFGVSASGDPQLISVKEDSFFEFHNITPDDLIIGLDVPNPNVSAVNTISELAEMISIKYPGNPLINNTANTGNEYAWNGYYWLRTYLHFYSVTKNLEYLDLAVELANKMLSDTDITRNRNSFSASNNYKRAPKLFLNERDKIAPGWERSLSDSSITVLTDGMILNGIMRIVDIIRTENLTDYFSFADSYTLSAHKIVDSHESSYSDSKNSAIKGSFYYVNLYNENYGDTGLYSNPLAHNHNLTMATAMLYLDKWGDRPDFYKTKIMGIIDFFTENLEFQNDGACTWNYNWDRRGESYERYEDISHGHIDVGFFVVADKEGYLNNVDVMKCLAKTAIERIAIGPGPIPQFVTGDGISQKSEQIAFSYDWRELSKFEPSIINRSNNIMRHAVGRINWFRQYAAIAMTLEK